MTWEQAMARADVKAARTGRRYRVARCRNSITGDSCPCGKWWVDLTTRPRPS